MAAAHLLQGWALGAASSVPSSDQHIWPEAVMAIQTTRLLVVHCEPTFWPAGISSDEDVSAA